jgi:hypothetical protein
MIEIDGIQHFAAGKQASPEPYTAMAATDCTFPLADGPVPPRRSRLRGRERVHRARHLDQARE